MTPHCLKRWCDVTVCDLGSTGEVQNLFFVDCGTVGRSDASVTSASTVKIDTVFFLR